MAVAMLSSAEVQALSNRLVTELGRTGRKAGKAGTAAGTRARPCLGTPGRRRRISPRGPTRAGAASRAPRPGGTVVPPAPCPDTTNPPDTPVPLARDSKGSRGSSLRMWVSSRRGAMGDASPRHPLALGARTGPSGPSEPVPAAAAPL